MEANKSTRHAAGWVTDHCPSELLSCACYLPPPAAATASAAPWRHDQARLLSTPIWYRQLGCAATVWYRGMLPFRGLGTAMLSHLNELVPVWILPADMSGGGPAYLPTDSDAAHPAGVAPEFLWAAMDSALSCNRWYDCYWDKLHGACASIPRNPKALRYVHQMAHTDSQGTRVQRAPYWRARYRSEFEARWGSLAFGAAMLDTWWRPSARLREHVSGRLRGMVEGLQTMSQSERHSLSWSCVAVHVRRGDACLTPWRRCPSLEEYLQPARFLVRAYGLRRLLILSDDEAVVRAVAANATREPWSEVIYQRIDRAWMTPPSAVGRAGGGSRWVDQWVEHRLHAWREDERRQERCVGGATTPSRKAKCMSDTTSRGVGYSSGDGGRRHEQPSGRPSHVTPIVDFVAEVEAGSRCSALVGDLLAGLSELVLLRMVTRLGHAPPVYSLGEGFCPLGGGPLRCRSASAGAVTSPRRKPNASNGFGESRSRWAACRKSFVSEREREARRRRR